MTAEQKAPTPSPVGLVARYEQSIVDRITDFNDPRQEWRRLVSELLGPNPSVGGVATMIAEAIGVIEYREVAAGPSNPVGCRRCFGHARPISPLL